MTAFDVDQPDTVGLGVPDPAQPGWDQHFGYGLPTSASRSSESTRASTRRRR